MTKQEHIEAIQEELEAERISSCDKIEEAKKFIRYETDKASILNCKAYIKKERLESDQRIEHLRKLKARLLN